MSHGFRKGDHARVKPLDQILSTLDADGTLEGLPFMPEMISCCGQTFPVSARVEHVFLDHAGYVARLSDTVRLSGPRCSGAAHELCQTACHLLWKKAWLEPADGPTHAASPPTTVAAEQVGSRETLAQLPLPTTRNGRLFCQATQLASATSRLPWWNPRQYYGQITGGHTTFGQLASMLLLLVRNKIRHRFRQGPLGMPSGPCTTTPRESLHLQPQELVQVKTLEEITATLDVYGKNRGMAFVPEMAAFCGKQFRVSHRVDRMISEADGSMIPLSNTVALEDVCCFGLAQRRCPRGCFHLWREVWLKRVPVESQAQRPILPQADCSKPTE